MPTSALKPIDPLAVATAEEQKFTPRNEKRMSALLDALCDPTRIKIVRALRDTPLAASDLAQRRGNVVRYTLSDDISGSIIEEAAAAFDQLQLAGTRAGR